MISRIPFLGGFNEAGSSYELPIDLTQEKQAAPLTQMQRDIADEQRKRDEMFARLGTGERATPEQVEAAVEGGEDMVFEPVAGQPGKFTTNRTDLLEVADERVKALPEIEWPAVGELFSWVKDLAPEAAIDLRNLCEKRLRELGCMR